MDAPSSDHNLLFGILALRSGRIDQAALNSALDAWSFESNTRNRTLADVLIGQGQLEPNDQWLVEQEVCKYLQGRRAQESERDPTDYDFELNLANGEPTRSIDASDSPIDSKPLDSSVQETVDASQAVTTILNMDPTHRATTSTGPPVQTASGHSKSERFRPIRLHARGGLGEVYVAWDAELGRHVALKEIRPEHADNPKLRARFLREAEINGNLEHPGIVPVYGLGSYPDGRPYYAMRFVEGETLHQAIEDFHKKAKDLSSTQWALKIRPLLGRFLDVCDAIAYAHSRNVLHRDLKPGNILLGKYNETIIIDWGLAKDTSRTHPQHVADKPDETQVQGQNDLEHLGPDPDLQPPVGSGSLPTVAGETIGSPPFMSPEQAGGRHSEIGQASDIYSLGATLYALLTGQAPLKDRNTSEILAKVCRGEIDPPSAVNPSVPKPLEAICRKAMQLDLADRYASAEALALDIEHWLADEPVNVHEDAISTRLLRWSRHHKPLVSATVALLLAAVVGLATTTAIVGEQKDRAELAQTVAERERNQAEEARRLAREDLNNALAFVNELVTIGDRQLIAQLPASTRSRILTPALEFIRRFRGRTPDDPTLQTQMAQLARRLANINQLIGEFEAADRFFEEAIGLLSEQQDPFPTPQNADLLAETLLDHAESNLQRGKATEAERQILQALNLARNNAQRFPEDRRSQRTLSRALSHLGEARFQLGQSQAALRDCQEAIERIHPLADAVFSTVREQVERGRYHALTDQLELVRAQVRCAQALQQLGSTQEAQELLQGTLARIEKLKIEFLNVEVIEIDYFYSIVITCMASFRIESAEPNFHDLILLLDEAISSLENLVAQDDQIWQLRASLANALLVRSYAQRGLQRSEKARADVNQARSHLETLIEEIDPVPEHQSLLGEIFEQLAQRTLDQDSSKRSETRDLLKRAIQFQEAALEASSSHPIYKSRIYRYLDLLRRLDTIDNFPGVPGTK